MSTDAELLNRYVRAQDNQAFAELVRRHINLVYSAALRRTGGRAHLAEEVAQTVFCGLSRKAGALLAHPSLTGWLYRSTRYAAIDAVRSELRGQKLAQALIAMPQDTLLPEQQIEWEKLRPQIDEAMDQLSERDREAMLLRYFDGLSFADVGARLSVSENAARMRTERALDKLRVLLGRRGLTSTTAALGLLLGSQAFAAAPAGLAASVASTAVATLPASGASLLFTYIVMNKIILTSLSMVFTAGVTSLVWTAVVPGISAKEMADLRLENVRLTRATAPDADPSAVAEIAAEYDAQAVAIAQALAKRSGGNAGAAAVSAGSATTASNTPAVTARGHRDHGVATAHDAAMTFAWAGDICDPDVLGRLIYFEAATRQKASAVLATMPEAIRIQYPTPERFYGMLLAAACLEAPPPGADILEDFEVVELSPGRAAHRPKGSTRTFHEYQQTQDGWKYVLPEAGVNGLPRNLNSETLARLSRR